MAYKSEEIFSCIQEVTSIVPGVYHVNNSVLVTFENNIPSQEEIKEIETSLKAFGNISPNHILEKNFVSFMIS